MATCEDGRSTVIGTRRNRTHGQATLRVITASTHTCQSEASAQRAARAATVDGEIARLTRVRSDNLARTLPSARCR